VLKEEIKSGESKITIFPSVILNMSHNLIFFSSV
jgi:hypothetical protein